MRTPVLFSLIMLFVTNATANQNPYGNVDMGAMVEQMQKMQNCMDKVDQTALTRLQQRGEKAEAKMKQQCRSGDEAAARETGMAFAREVRGSAALKQMQTCVNMMRGFLPPEMTQLVNKLKAQKYEEASICSGL